MCPPQSPTRTTKNSILKLAGAFHCPNTSRIRFWAFSYSAGEPCGRSFQLITYFISSPFFIANGLIDQNRLSLLLGGIWNWESCGKVSGWLTSHGQHKAGG